MFCIVCTCQVVVEEERGGGSPKRRGCLPRAREKERVISWAEAKDEETIQIRVIQAGQDVGPQMCAIVKMQQSRRIKGCKVLILGTGLGFSL